MLDQYIVFNETNRTKQKGTNGKVRIEKPNPTDRIHVPLPMVENYVSLPMSSHDGQLITVSEFLPVSHNIQSTYANPARKAPNK